MSIREVPTDNGFLNTFTTIYGFSVSDLIMLAQTLRDTGLTPEDLKEANRIFIEGARYACDKLNESVSNKIIESFNAPEEEDLLSQAKEIAKKWRYNNERE